ncbi:MAG: excinuclease ABC subunit A [Gammaproteobacteria bacterium RIFCSPHIGHO2_12_FULL_41_15]|nr:MAG: excinuclease ABC subunit A [Gammaproteobacteria bacterium RIFCSPHIGHO2_12_FULL_41_15]
MSADEFIRMRGVRTHNLKNVDIDIPRDQLVVITGLSGSGKSSLAFDTLYAEGQRRYVESLSSYARQFLSMMSKPDMDLIEGLSPAIAIEQKTASHNPRSTVGTITEIYDYLRLLYARVGTPRCPVHHINLEAQTVSQMVDWVLQLKEGTKIMLLAPVVRERKGEHQQLLDSLHKQGYVRARIDGKVLELEDAPKLSLRQKHTIEVVVDRIKVREDIQQRLAESFETILRLSNGLAVVSFMDEKRADHLFSANYACKECGYSLEELEPRLFSFNNPKGACSECDGLGVTQSFDTEKVVVNSDASLADGAIRGWDRRTLYYFQLLTSLAEHYGFDVEKSFADLPKKIQTIILQGSGREKIKFHYVNHRGDTIVREQPFEGVIPNLRRRYHETESNAVREELAKYLTVQTCQACEGSRLCLEARHVFVDKTNLHSLVEMPIGQALAFFKALQFTGKKAVISEKILKEICDRLGFLVNVGLDYLMLSRSAETLSGGEAQRIRLASQIGSGLVGVMYILDEPSIGLHQRDNDRLLQTLRHLRDLGNTVIMVEHDEDAIRTSDFVIDIGPGAGVHGGEIVAKGTPKQVIANTRSLTGKYLSGKEAIAIPHVRQKANPEKMLKITGASCNNLKQVNVEFPIGLMTCVTGVSGSGKSSLVNDTLYPVAAKALNGASQLSPGAYQSISGIEHLDKVVDIDQSPIGRTPRSNPATYTGIFTPIREIFAGTQEARSRGYQAGRFSFNVKGGRCEACEGGGVIKVEMHFLADVYVTCDLCKGKRYNRETLEIKFKGKNIYEVLEMTVETALHFFENIPVLKRRLQTLMEVGLSYINLGQSAITLSGGEAQRIKLSRELSKRDTGHTLYILDEPTTGLHFHDVKQLLSVLEKLRDNGNTIIVIEHNLDVIKVADWIVDIGPEGGSGGGTIVATGSPEEVAENKQSYTGHYLKKILNQKQRKSAS